MSHESISGASNLGRLHSGSTCIQFAGLKNSVDVSLTVTSLAWLPCSSSLIGWYWQLLVYTDEIVHSTLIPIGD